jgi:hypothetical protein
MPVHNAETGTLTKKDKSKMQVMDEKYRRENKKGHNLKLFLDEKFII